MRVWQIEGGFGLENLKLAERRLPTPGPGQVVLAMKAASLNYRDLLMVKGEYDPRQKLPLVPCSDGVGEVVAVGDDVTRVAPGDRVATCFSQTWPGGPPSRERLRGTLGGPFDGVLTQRMLLSAEGVVRVPEHLTDAEAATLPCAGVTAWSALVEHGGITAGQTVLVQGTGGVSIIALQLARVLGARVIVTSSSDAKLARARELGAWQTINYREDPSWGKTARALTDGVGVDLVVEVGGAGTLEQSLKAVSFGGTVIVLGVLSGYASELNILPIFMQQVKLQGLLVGPRDAFEAMNRAIASAGLRPVVDRVVPFEDVPEALGVMERAEHFGKIVIAVS